MVGQRDRRTIRGLPKNGKADKTHETADISEIIADRPLKTADTSAKVADRTRKTADTSTKVAYTTNKTADKNAMQHQRSYTNPRQIGTQERPCVPILV